MVIYALIVMVALLVSTTVVVAFIIRAPLVEDDGDDRVGVPLDTNEQTEPDPDAATSVGARHGEN
jgi:hypothetical protein